LEGIDAEARRREAIPRVEASVQIGNNLLTAGQFEHAKAEAELALQLDPTFLPARELLAQVQAAIERARALAQSLRAAQQRLAEGALTDS
jgi:Tfp pilus assembly protein PilF